MNLNERIRETERIIADFLPEAVGKQAKIAEVMRYTFLSGGKRLRPMLMRETHVFFGGESRAVYPFMAAIEMIHTYSLIHDDLPAMDNDDYRRGRKTAHKQYNEALAILGGDALLNCGFETAIGAFEAEPESAGKISRSLKILGEKTGIKGMLGGQVIDIVNSGCEIDQDTLDTLVTMKTAALLEASMMIGAVLAGAGEEDVRKIERVARCAGIAFQIQDDILDVTGTQEKLGKPVLSDEKNNKMTYVKLYGLEKAGEMANRHYEESFRLLQDIRGKNEYLTQLLRALIGRDR